MSSSSYVTGYDALTENLLVAAVDRIHFWAHQPRGSTVAHWLTTYELKHPVDGHRGISLNMHQPTTHLLHPVGSGGINFYGTLDISLRDKQLTSERPLLKVTINVHGNMTVRALTDTVLNHRMQFYKFHEHGSGCMYWQLEVLSYLQKEKWIMPRDTVEVNRRIEALGNRASIPFPPVQGTFYEPPGPRAMRR